MGKTARGPLVILATDPGHASAAAALLECHGKLIICRRLEVLRTVKNPNVRVMDDEDRRLREYCDMLGRVRGDAVIEVLAYEWYRPFKAADGEYQVAHGRTVAKSEGVAIGYAVAIGAKSVPVDPARPKRILKASSKKDVSTVLEARIQGLTQLLDRAGRSGHHGSDAVGIGYTAMVDFYKKAAGAT